MSRARRCVAAVILAFPALACAQLSPSKPPLPDRLSDSAFFQLITQVSEPNGFFDSDNLLSNEPSYQRVIPALGGPAGPSGVYLGVGPEQNFSYIAALQPRMAIIFDIRRGNMLLQLLYKGLFELSPARADFLARLYSRPRPAGLDTLASVAQLCLAYDGIAADSALYARNWLAVRDHSVRDHGFPLATEDLVGIKSVYDAFYRAGPALDYNYPNPPRSGRGGGQRPTYASLMQLDDGQGAQRSFLATESAYRVVRQMEESNLIVPVVGDFAGPKAIVGVAAYLKEHDATVTAFYTSNVEQYLFQDPTNWRSFYTNVGALPVDTASVFIRSVFASGNAIPGLASTESVSLLAPIAATVDAFRRGRLRTYVDAVNIGR